MRLRTAMALSQLGKGQDAAAFNDLQAIAAGDKGIGADIALISAKLHAKDYPGALKAVDALAAKQPSAPLADQLRARIALMKNDTAGARKHFESAVAKDADYMPALAGLAALDLADKRPAAAQARFEALLQRQPNNPGALMALAEIGKRSGAKIEQTVLWLEQAITADPADARPRMMLIDDYLGAGQFKPALTVAAAAVAAQPANVELLDRLGRAQLLSGDSQQAVSSFSKLVGLAPKSALPQLRLADAQLAANNRSGAAAAVRRAAELAPGTLPVLQAQINLALLDNKPEQAIVIARKLQADHPDDAIGFALEGDVALRQQRWDEAAAALRKAITRKDPGLSVQRLHAALTAGKKTAEAGKLAADWRKSHPDDMGFVLHLGDMALSVGDKAQAEAQYRLVVEREPGNTVALNNLAYLLAQLNKPGAVAMAEQALKAAPDSPALLDTLAFALAADKQLPRAIEVQTRAVAAAPNAPQFAMQLARLYLQSGDKTSAREQLNKLAQLGAAFPGQAEVAGMLKAAGE
jgi:putative PEP-CTERM system TPR-repeat lipoprotein